MAYLAGRDGVRLHYEVHGGGPTVLLTHGFTLTSGMWQRQVEALSDRYRVVTWDVRGHGQSDYPGEPARYSVAHTVADMAALLDACDTQTAVVGGLSLGGYLSLAFHLAHPQRCEALVLCDTGPGFKKDQARADWNTWTTAYADKLERDGLAALGADARASRSVHRDASGLALAARGILSQADAAVMHSLPDITVPTLVIVGENDEPFLGASEYMAEKIPNADMATIPEAGHVANIDNPAAFNDALAGFLGRVFE